MILSNTGLRRPARSLARPKGRLTVFPDLVCNDLVYEFSTHVKQTGEFGWGVNALIVEETNSADVALS
jgi:hypothetical protein